MSISDEFTVTKDDVFKYFKHRLEDENILNHGFITIHNNGKIKISEETLEEFKKSFNEIYNSNIDVNSLSDIEIKDYLVDLIGNKIDFMKNKIYETNKEYKDLIYNINKDLIFPVTTNVYNKLYECFYEDKLSLHDLGNFIVAFDETEKNKLRELLINNRLTFDFGGTFLYNCYQHIYPNENITEKEVKGYMIANYLPNTFVSEIINEIVHNISYEINNPNNIIIENLNNTTIKNEDDIFYYVYNKMLNELKSKEVYAMNDFIKDLQNIKLLDENFKLVIDEDCLYKMFKDKTVGKMGKRELEFLKEVKPDLDIKHLTNREIIKEFVDYFNDKNNIDIIRKKYDIFVNLSEDIAQRINPKYSQIYAMNFDMSVEELEKDETQKNFFELDIRNSFYYNFDRVLDINNPIATYEEINYELSKTWIHQYFLHNEKLNEKINIEFDIPSDFFVGVDRMGTEFEFEKKPKIEETTKRTTKGTLNIKHN